MRFSSFILFLSLLQSPGLQAANPLAPSHLRSCDQINPVGTDNKPFFGWYVHDADDDEIQTAYQLLVATTPQQLEPGKADVWDSKKTESRLQNYIPFNGSPLSPATRYYWKVRTWDKNGHVSPWSAISHFDTGLFSFKDWDGALWIRRNTSDPNNYTYFRKTLRLTHKPIKRATVYLSAFHNYTFYINGQLVGKGLAYHYPQYAYYNAYDVTDLIGRENTLAALTHWYGGGQGRAKGTSGFLLKLIVEYADGTQTVFGTDGSWKQHAVDAFDAHTKRRNGEGVGYIDVIDSRKIISTWNQPAFDDTQWPAADVIGPHPSVPFTGELQADLTRLKEEPIKPASIKKLNKDSYLIDLGKIYAGMPQITFEGGRAGDTVHMRGGFVLNADGTVSDTMNQHTDLAYHFVLNGRQATFKPEVYLGYRYLQVNGTPIALSTQNVRFISRYYELEPARAHFTSSNDMLNRVWALMIHSLTLGAQESFVDTPTREKGAFLGDGWSQGVAAMLTMGERALNHRVLLEFLDSQDQYWPDGRLNSVYPNADGKRDIPDYTQQYLLWVWDYYMQTGNIEFLNTHYKQLKKVADYVATYIQPATGLVHQLAGGSGPYQYGIIDWPAPMRYGYDMATEARTVINAYAYADFTILEQVATLTGNLQDASDYRAKATGIKQAMNKYLINPDGVYIDGLLADGTPSKHISQHANMFPLALGIVPDRNRTVVINAVKQRKMHVGMVTLGFLPQALGEADEGRHLLNLYTNPEWDGWAKTISLGGTATWESWDAPQRNESLCHPWGAIGLAGIQHYFLGVKSLQPQHTHIQVKSLDFGEQLSHASGTVPTDKGDIQVAWEREQAYRLTLTLPDNMQADVYIPRGEVNNNTVRMNGRAIQAVPHGRYLSIKNVGSGQHVFERELR